jgi:hypothetical protein
LIERLGLLFSDGSFLVLPEGTDLSTAQREAEEHDAGEAEPRTKVVVVKIEVLAVAPGAEQQEPNQVQLPNR